MCALRQHVTTSKFLAAHCCGEGARAGRPLLEGWSVDHGNKSTLSVGWSAGRDGRR